MSYIAKEEYAAKVVITIIGVFILMALMLEPHWQSYSESLNHLDTSGELGTDGTELYYTNGGTLSRNELIALEVLSDHYTIHINE